MLNIYLKVQKSIGCVHQAIRQKHTYPKEVRDKINFSKVRWL